VEIPAVAVDFKQGTDVSAVFYRLAQLRNTAVHRLLQSTETIQSFVADAIIITEGLRDGARAMQLHQIRDALKNNDPDAIFRAVSTPHRYFQMNQVNNPRQWLALPSSARVGNQSMTNGQHQIVPVNDLQAISRAILDESGVDSRDSRSRSWENVWVSRPRGRSDSPHRRPPSSIRIRDAHSCPLEALHGQPKSLIYDSDAIPLTPPVLEESDDRESFWGYTVILFGLAGLEESDDEGTNHIFGT